MDMNQAIAKAISAERAISGMTVRELSEASGIPVSTLMRILSAERDIKILWRGFPASCGRGGITVWPKPFPFVSGCIA